MKPLFSPSWDLSRVKVADRFAGLSETIEEDIYWKQTRWSPNDKTIIELGYRKILWFVIVSQMNSLLYN